MTLHAVTAAFLLSRLSIRPPNLFFCDSPKNVGLRSSSLASVRRLLRTAPAVQADGLMGETLAHSDVARRSLICQNLSIFFQSPSEFQCFSVQFCLSFIFSLTTTETFPHGKLSNRPSFHLLQCPTSSFIPFPPPALYPQVRLLPLGLCAGRCPSLRCPTMALRCLSLL